MTYEQYERRANEIDAWAKAQYEAGKLSEDQIEKLLAAGVIADRL